MIPHYSFHVVDQVSPTHNRDFSPTHRGQVKAKAISVSGNHVLLEWDGDLMALDRVVVGRRSGR